MVLSLYGSPKLNAYLKFLLDIDIQSIRYVHLKVPIMSK